MRYRGRFAPSPSGPLHFGSVVTAIASYLDAKSQHGDWLIRIEDIDPPREVEGASDIILEQLAALSLQSDEAVTFQSDRLASYQQQVELWLQNRQAYYCQCPRKRLKSLKHIYDGYCRDKQRPQQGAAVRFKNTIQETHFFDRIYNQVNLAADVAGQDFIIRRKDGLIAYQIAVVMDDIAQQISHIVRGSDLLETTLWQRSLYQALNTPVPNYAHIPVIIDASGRKLSKQNGAPGIRPQDAKQTCFAALNALQLAPPTALKIESPSQQLAWALENWQLPTVTNTR
ncbi:tRNA glutamyl-Q(34) synthetase GluQRS [Gayadomonas joobiniege]|uniref:tRNA glutamyl-Q(34) synthetase GluQRS n=1 Tax=Gayadomonas joobiniege TaxID=1234606 RepID=UPI0003802C1A|nr:tRNA glutamyl-Q(34) synthetase GluQRS [Gayadomonas joobiniege]